MSTCKTRRNKTRTPLPQTDRATRRRSKSGRNKLYNESRTNRSDAQLQGYSRQTCNKLYAPGHEASTITGVIHKLDRRRILTTPPTCRGEIILVQSSGDISTQKTCKIVFKQSLRKYCQKSFRDMLFSAAPCTYFWLQAYRYSSYTCHFFLHRVTTFASHNSPNLSLPG